MQFDLFRKPRRPGVQRPRTMFVIDAGLVGDRSAGRFSCNACGYETDWVHLRSSAVEGKGRVCPQCKGVSEDLRHGET